MEHVTLSNGIKMPILGYGVFQIDKADSERCVLDALKAGYRSFDTAQSYRNEAELGSALKISGVPREDLFLTSKVWISNYGYDNCLRSVEQSLEALGTDYIDLMLLHQPFGDYYGAWHALENLYEQGVLRAIGVANFYSDRLVDLAQYARIAPMLNQIETHPFYQRNDERKWMGKYDIRHEAWAPLGEGKRGVFSDPELKAIGDKYGKSPAQVILRWHIQRGTIVIPKSTHYERMVQNINVFDFALSDEDMAKIAAMDTGKTSFFSQRDPEIVEQLAERAKSGR